MTADESDVTTVSADGVTARYYTTDTERILEFSHGDDTATIAQNIEGYAMLKVRVAPDGDVLERYYGFDMALDHAAEVLGVRPGNLPVPEEASTMGM